MQRRGRGGAPAEKPGVNVTAAGASGFIMAKMATTDAWQSVGFAALMEREHVKPGASDRYVAVIDCRGEKAARRYFTRWHEIAHLLTLVKQLELPFHRSKETKQDPIERLMDTIAGDVGFFEPLFKPALQAELAQTGLLTFDGVQRIRDRMCPNASFQSVLIACTNRSPIPTITLETKMAYKKAEAAELHSTQLQMFVATKPKPKLRAVVSTQNLAARDARFIIHRNMTIPAASLVAKHFEETEEPQNARLIARGKEDLSIWRHSDGDPVGCGTIHIEAKRTGTSLVALIQRPPRSEGTL